MDKNIVMCVRTHSVWHRGTFNKYWMNKITFIKKFFNSQDLCYLWYKINLYKSIAFIYARYELETISEITSFLIQTKHNLDMCKLVKNDLEPRGIKQQNIDKWYKRWLEYLKKTCLAIGCEHLTFKRCQFLQCI